MDDNDIGERLRHLQGKCPEELIQEFSGEFELLHRELAALKSEVAALANYNASRGLHLEPPALMPVPSLPQRVAIEADQMLRAHDGFYGIEHTSDGIPFRWTGPSVQFCFSVFVDRSNGADLRLSALSSIDFDLQKDVSLIVDGETVPVNVEADDTGFSIVAYLPPREDRGATGLVFVLPQVLTPPGGADPRPLGIAFARLLVSARRAEIVEMNEVSDTMAAQ
jgi:hypothetical protein